MLMVHHSLVCMFNSSHLKKKKDLYAERRRKGKTNSSHTWEGWRQEKHQISQKYTIAVCNVGSGNKVVREKLQSKEKTLLGNGKIKTEGDM